MHKRAKNVRLDSGRDRIWKQKNAELAAELNQAQSAIAQLNTSLVTLMQAQEGVRIAHDQSKRLLVAVMQQLVEAVPSEVFTLGQDELDHAGLFVVGADTDETGNLQIWLEQKEVLDENPGQE